MPYKAREILAGNKGPRANHVPRAQQGPRAKHVPRAGRRTRDNHVHSSSGSQVPNRETANWANRNLAVRIPSTTVYKVAMRQGRSVCSRFRERKQQIREHDSFDIRLERLKAVEQRPYRFAFTTAAAPITRGRPTAESGPGEHPANERTSKQTSAVVTAALEAGAAGDTGRQLHTTSKVPARYLGHTVKEVYVTLLSRNGASAYNTTSANTAQERR